MKINQLLIPFATATSSNSTYSTYNDESNLFRHCKRYFEYDKFPAPSNLEWITHEHAQQERTRYPWLVSVGGHCSGVLIGPRWVITAAHCCSDPINQYVYAGSDSAIDRDHAYRIEDYRRHDKFNIATVQNDICLLKTAENIPFTASTFPICLVSRRSKASIPGATGAVAGWGDQTEFGQASGDILEESLRVSEHKDCQQTYHYFDERKSFCAEPEISQRRKEKHHQCIGDSGAPLVMLESDGENGETTPVLVGLASWGHGCPVGRPRGIYVNIANFISWLTNKAIEMKAHMTSAKVKRLNGINIKSVNGTAPSAKMMRQAVKNIHKEHKRRRKTLNQRRKTNILMRKARLTKRFQLKMASKGVQAHDKDLKKFLKSRFKKNSSQQEFLTPKEIEKLQTISRSLAKTREHAIVCSKSEAEVHFSEHFIKISTCDFVGTSFECRYTCSMTETDVNGRITCANGVWTEYYDSDVEHLCVASSKKPKKLKTLPEK